MNKGSEFVCVGLTILDILGCPIDQIPDGSSTSIIQQIRLTAAGTAGGPAVIGAKLGMETSLVGAVGKDDIADFLLMLLKKHGVNSNFIQQRDELPTATTMLTVNSKGDRPNFHAIGSTILLELDEKMHEHVVNSKYIHWGGVGTMLKLDNGPAVDILKEAKSNGAVITTDFIAPGEQTLDLLKLILPYVDYFMPSMDEAMEVAGTTTPEDTAEFYLNLGVDTCLFKWGANGSLIATSDMQKHIPAFKVAVVDTTGCGDSYCAGFTAGLSKGFDLEKAALFATATSALVATGLGSDAGVVNFEETLKAMETLEILKIE